MLIVAKVAGARWGIEAGSREGFNKATINVVVCLIV